ncbi:RQC domain-containing protein, partial [Bacteroidota bacterium]
TPKSLEGYYQETGRAGRDGLEGNCIMFYSYNDILKLEKFNKDKTVTERENARILLDEMASYSESSECRRKQLLHYFGEEYKGEECGKTMWCDSCRHPVEKFEGKKYAIMAINAALQTGERFGLNHLANVIRGVENQYVKSYKHNDIEIFGKGKEKDEDFWKNIIRSISIHGLLKKDIEVIGVLKVTDRGKEFLNNPVSIKISEKHDYTVEDEDENGEREPMPQMAYDETLFSILKSLRKNIAKEKGFPPYVIFQDPSLEEMATTYPTSEDELAQINGVGKGKIEKFGKPFVEAISDYVEENDITTASDVVVKTSGNKSRTKINIIQQIDRKTDLEEIAESKGMTFPELLSELEQICYSGTRLNLDYYIEEYMDDEVRDEIFDYFLNAENDSILDALNEFSDFGFEEEDMRLMRIKFLSEFAN